MSAMMDRAAPRGSAERVGPQPGVVVLFAWIGAGFLALVAWCWIRWILSDNFRPVDPGLDALPAWREWALTGLQVGGLVAAAAFIWIWALKPRLTTGRWTTDGLACLVLPTLWFQDLMFAYSQTWMSYNAHLWNMGSWASQVPGWMGRHPENMLEPVVTFYGYIFWMFACMLFICWFMRRLAVRRPGLSHAELFWYGFLFTCALDLVVEMAAIRIGWYSTPGAWRATSLFAGTPYQVPLLEILFGAIQTMAFAAVLFYKDDKGYSFVERGAERIAAGPKRTAARALALAGALHLFFFVTYSMPMSWVGLHSDPWVDGMPSYFTAMCPEYATDRRTCGGPGIPVYRPPSNWLPE
jgi:hypothetical protein